MKIKTIIQRFMISAGAAALLGVAPAVTADTLKTLGWAAPSPGYQTFGVAFPTNQTSSPRTGGFKGTWNGDDIIFWCIQLDEYFGLNNTYTDYVASAAPNTASMILLDKLFETAYPTATSTVVNSAAFQLAIWEIIYDHTNLQLTGANKGVFYITNPATSSGTNWATVTAAQALLDNLGNANTDNYSLTLLLSAGVNGNRGHQDFVTASKAFRFLVPEPNGLWLILAALGAMFAVSRRRSRITA